MADDERPAHDVVLLHSRTEDGEGIRALRSRPRRLELAEIRPTRPGKPISGELVRLHPRKETPLLCDVEVQYSAEESGGDATGHDGPPRVATRSYRDNWEMVFGKKKPGGRLVN